MDQMADRARACFLSRWRVFRGGSLCPGPRPAQRPRPAERSCDLWTCVSPGLAQPGGGLADSLHSTHGDTGRSGGAVALSVLNRHTCFPSAPRSSPPPLVIFGFREIT